MSDLVYESFDVSDACGSEFGVRLTAVWRSITHLPVGLDAAQFGEVALQGALGSGAGAVDGGLYAVRVFGWGCIRSGGFQERATTQAPGSLHGSPTSTSSKTGPSGTRRACQEARNSI